MGQLREGQIRAVKGLAPAYLDLVRAAAHFAEEGAIGRDTVCEPARAVLRDFVAPGDLQAATDLLIFEAAALFLDQLGFERMTPRRRVLDSTPTSEKVEWLRIRSDRAVRAHLRRAVEAGALLAS